MEMQLESSGRCFHSSNVMNVSALCFLQLPNKTKRKPNGVIPMFTQRFEVNINTELFVSKTSEKWASNVDASQNLPICVL
jgi:hypothetical protein